MASTKTTSKKVTANKELALIKRLYNYNGKVVTTQQLKLMCNDAKELLSNKKCNHKNVIQKIANRLSVAVDNLEKLKIIGIKKLEVKNDLFTQLENLLHNPMAKTVTLGKATALKKKLQSIGHKTVY